MIDDENWKELLIFVYKHCIDVISWWIVRIICFYGATCLWDGLLEMDDFIWRIESIHSNNYRKSGNGDIRKNNCVGVSLLISTSIIIFLF